VAERSDAPAKRQPVERASRGDIEKCKVKSTKCKMSEETGGWWQSAGGWWQSEGGWWQSAAMPQRRGNQLSEPAGETLKSAK
jgi:hypothetical protein